MGLELEAWDMVINSCPFEDLVQLSLGEDQRPLSKAAVVGPQGQSHDNRIKVYLHGSPDGWEFVSSVPSSSGASASRSLLNLASRLPLATFQELSPAGAELVPCLQMQLWGFQMMSACSG